jgi:hypothetical protein
MSYWKESRQDCWLGSELVFSAGLAYLAQFGTLNTVTHPAAEDLRRISK